MSPVRLNLLVLKARDLERSRAFYSALGLELIEEKHGQGPMHYSACLGEMVLEIYPYEGNEPGPERTHRLGFTVSSFAAILPNLESLDAAIVKPPEKTPWGMRAILADPDGRLLEVYQVEATEE